jgi:hypothetical protein
LRRREAFLELQPRTIFYTVGPCSWNSILRSAARCLLFITDGSFIQRSIQKFPDWPPGERERTANGIALCH